MKGWYEGEWNKDEPNGYGVCLFFIIVFIFKN